MNNILCVFQNANSTQHTLFKLLQPWHQVPDNGGFIRIILMDLPKTYDFVPHNLLIAKLECYVVDKASIKLLLDYLTRRKQRTKIGSSFNSWFDTKTGVPQESILGPLLFNMFINNLFFFHSFPEVCNYADHNTFFIGDKNLGRVFFNINSDLSDVMDCFKINSLKANPDRFQFKILAPNKNNYFNIRILTGKKHRQIKLSKN